MNHTKALMASALTGLFVIAGPAYSADLGGNCCADLEERVAELEATAARKGNRVVTLHVYGQINVAILHHDIDGLTPQTKMLGTNSNSTTRFGFRGEGRINSDWKAGYQLEVGVNPTTDGIDIRHAYLYIQSKQLGTIAMGQTSQATDGIMEVDLSRSAIASTQGSLAPFDAFIKENTSPSIGIPNFFDGTRKEVLKWASPTIAGFTLSAAWSDDQSYDIALRMAQEFGNIRVALGGGYRVENDTSGVPGAPQREFYGGSGSIMHVTSGLFVGGFYGVSKGIHYLEVGGVPLTIPGAVTSELTMYGGRGGVEVKAFSLGKTTIFGEYTKLEGSALGGSLDLLEMYGGGIVQAIDPAAMSLYLSYRHYELLPGTASEEANVIVGGAIIKF